MRFRGFAVGVVDGWWLGLTGALTISGVFVHGRRADSLVDMVFDVVLVLIWMFEGFFMH